jgi:hypothetical protein
VAGDAYGIRRQRSASASSSSSATAQSPTATLTPGALMAPFSPASMDTRTLLYDFFFSAFDANATLDHGPLHAGSQG